MSDEPLDYLTTEDLLEIAAGVIGNVAVRDEGLLASAPERPRTSAFGVDAYLTCGEGGGVAGLLDLVQQMR